MTPRFLPYIAHFLSFVFHPLWIPLMGLFVLFQADTYLHYIFPQEVLLLIYLIVFLNTVVFPALLTFFLYKRKIISTFMLKKREERFYAYIGTVLFYLSTLYFLLKINMPLVITRFIIGATFVVFLCLIINFYIKISAHMAGLGGITTGIYLFSLKMGTPLIFAFVFFIIVSGLVATSRLLLLQHSPVEIIAGYLVGIGGIWLTF